VSAVFDGAQGASVRSRARRVPPVPAAPRRSPQVRVIITNGTVADYREALLRGLRANGFGLVGVDDQEAAA